MPQPQADLLLRNARLDDRDTLTDIAMRDGLILSGGDGTGGTDAVQVAAKVIDLKGRAVLPGLVDSHIHLDKARLSCRCAGGGDLRAAVAAVSALKRGFTEQDVRTRAEQVVRAAITQGTMHMRSHVEVDPRAGLRSLSAIVHLRKTYRFALDIQICAFAQEGLTHDPDCVPLMVQALAQGADLLGGCPYTDPDPVGHIRQMFQLAVDHDVDLDFHLDFDLDPSWSHMDAIGDETQRHGWQGRVVIGHVTKLSVMPDAAFDRYAKMLAKAGVAVIALPSTDLYLGGIELGHRAPRAVAPVHLLPRRGVNVAVASNNILNPFTPFGDCSLLRMANLYANIMHIDATGFADCIDMVTHGPARMMRIENYGLRPGDRADLVVLDAPCPSEAMATIAPPVLGIKSGKISFQRPLPRISGSKDPDWDVLPDRADD